MEKLRYIRFRLVAKVIVRNLVLAMRRPSHR